MAHAVIGDRGAVFGKLQWREHTVGLADGGLHTVAYRPGLADQLHVVFAVCHVALVLGQLDTRRLAEAEIPCIFIQLVDAQVVTDGVEEYVAGMLYRLGHVKIAVGQLVLSVYPAVRRVAVLGITGELAGTLYRCSRTYDALGQSRYRRAGLEGRSGGILAEQGAVVKRIVVRGRYLLILVQQLAGVIVRPACQRQRLAGIDLDDGYRGAVDLVVLFLIGSGCDLLLLLSLKLLANARDAVFQRKLRGLLEGDVDRQIHIVAGFRFLGIFGAYNRAVRRRGRTHRTVRTVEVFFKGVLGAGLADLRVAGVAESLVLCGLLVVHEARVAENVRGGLGAVFAHKGLLDVYAFYIVLADGGDELHIRVLNENIVRGVYQVADVHRVAHAGDYPCLLGGVVAVDIIACAHA